MSKARIVLPIEGMSCASCAATVQAALGEAAGVSTATVNYATGKSAVEYDDARTSVAELIKTVRAAGYDCGRASVTFTVEQLHYAPSVAPLEQALRRAPGVARSTRSGSKSDSPSSRYRWWSGRAASSIAAPGAGSSTAPPT